MTWLLIESHCPGWRHCWLEISTFPDTVIYLSCSERKKKSNITSGAPLNYNFWVHKGSNNRNTVFSSSIQWAALWCATNAKGKRLAQGRKCQLRGGGQKYLQLGEREEVKACRKSERREFRLHSFAPVLRSILSLRYISNKSYSFIYWNEKWTASAGGATEACRYSPRREPNLPHYCLNQDLQNNSLGVFLESTISSAEYITYPQRRGTVILSWMGKPLTNWGQCF